MYETGGCRRHILHSELTGLTSKASYYKMKMKLESPNCGQSQVFYDFVNLYQLNELSLMLKIFE